MSISDEQLRAVLATYDRKSIWYARDILGQRRAAEGLIYDMFDFTANVYHGDLAHCNAGRFHPHHCGQLRTLNPTCFLSIFDDGETCPC